MPITIIISLLWLDIEPPIGLLLNAPNDQPDVLGFLIVLGLALFLPVALVVVLAPVVRSIRGEIKQQPIPLTFYLLLLFCFSLS